MHRLCGPAGVLALGAAGDAPAATGSKADEARTLALVSDIAIGLGIVAAGIGAYLFFFADGEESAEGSVQVGPVFDENFAGAAAAIRFE